MFILTKPLNKIYSKIRHRHGHGVHSPFVFHLIEDVIENKWPYYAYKDIEKYIKKSSGKKYKTKNFNRLSFQLIHYFKAKKVLQIGFKDEQTLYSTAASKTIKCTVYNPQKQNSTTLFDRWNHSISEINSLPEENIKFDCILINLKKIAPEKILNEDLFSYVDEHSVIILKNIRTNKHVYSLVKNIQQDERVRIALDLHKTSILFFDKKYFKQNYLLSF